MRCPGRGSALKVTAAHQREAKVALKSEEILEHTYIRYDKGTIGVNRKSINYRLELAGGNTVEA